ncbi:MAG: T9SS type A sorting domain-containing protein [Saprospiraceae bacterium]
MRIYTTLLILFICSSAHFGQSSGTANDSITPYTGSFLYGANMGYYPQWSNKELADIAAGNSSAGVSGAGVKSLRPLVPEYFLEQYGYDYLLSDFVHYDTLGIKDNTVMIGYPSDEHLDPVFYCEDYSSNMFENMYTDIWDDGENGTPYNDANYYAAYLFEVVSLYKDYIKFYEIWNEPDFDYGSFGWRPSGQEGNWWDADPNPCDLAIKAPVQHYVRLLRISYEVIKTVDPTAYVCVGGLGYESFLDAVLRNTDNPLDGSVTSEYPLYGGAYFDVLSFHSYPHIDGSLREWNNDLGQFDYFRHSDAAVDGVINKKASFENVLENHNYDGETYPKKIAIITESNVPRKEFGEYLGTNEAQKNFISKALIAAQANDIRQFYVFNLAERATYEDASSSTKLMGLYEELYSNGPYSQIMLDAGKAYKTTSDLLFDLQYDSNQTNLLNLNDSIGGAAFLNDSTGQYTYVLWAKTQIDKEEIVADTFSFPLSMGVLELELKSWNYVETETIDTIDAVEIPLTGTPVFLRDFINTALPVELASFVATPQEKQVLLTWLTLSELNSDYFEIEHSVNGVDFNTIGKVRAKGNSVISQHYEYNHTQPSIGYNYYRLKQTDLDGTSSYSKIKQVSWKSTNELIIRPTITSSEITLELSEELITDLNLDFYNSTGQFIKTEIFPAGQHEITMNLHDLPKGHYFIKANNSRDEFIGRFLKK